MGFCSHIEQVDCENCRPKPSRQMVFPPRQTELQPPYPEPWPDRRTFYDLEGSRVLAELKRLSDLVEALKKSQTSEPAEDVEKYSVKSEQKLSVGCDPILTRDGKGNVWITLYPGDEITIKRKPSA